MKDIQVLHHQAMELADLAFDAQKKQHTDYTILLQQAYQLECEAAMMLLQDIAQEPTRAILFRSAASLAWQCGEAREAEKLIAYALSGNPPQAIASELRDLLQKVYAMGELV